MRGRPFNLKPDWKCERTHRVSESLCGLSFGQNQSLWRWLTEQNCISRGYDINGMSGCELRTTRLHQGLLLDGQNNGGLRNRAVLHETSSSIEESKMRNADRLHQRYPDVLDGLYASGSQAEPHLEVLAHDPSPASMRSPRVKNECLLMGTVRNISVNVTRGASSTSR